VEWQRRRKNIGVEGERKGSQLLKGYDIYERKGRVEAEGDCRYRKDSRQNCCNLERLGTKAQKITRTE
jgi:hypothetical protein